MTDEEITEFYREIGARIRKYRKKIGMKPEMLAQQLGLTRPSIVNIEKGRHKPSIDTLLQISELLFVSYTELIPSTRSEGGKIRSPKKSETIITDTALKNRSAEKILKEFIATINQENKGNIL